MCGREKERRSLAHMVVDKGASDSRFSRKRKLVGGRRVFESMNEKKERWRPRESFLSIKSSQFRIAIDKIFKL